jgi:diazepam-binding inhibitor (GABA receptor modulating acyl-CoA-binding protein)
MCGAGTGAGTGGGTGAASAASAGGSDPGAPGSVPARCDVPSARVLALSADELKDTFKRALECVRPFLKLVPADAANAHHALSDTDKLLFYGYFKQASRGDIPPGPSTPSDPQEAAKLEAWSTMKGVSHSDAMRLFVDLLDKAVPLWDN